MIALYIPFLVGIALGIAPPDASAPSDADSAGSITREPEPQVPTGQFTTAVEVKPIIGMTKDSWVAVREFDGRDLVYFTHLLSWRCGMWDIRYSVNGDDAFQTFEMEPCHADTAQPNAMTEIDNYLPYLSFPPGSVDSIHVEVLFDDGTTDAAVFERAAVLMP